MIFHGKFGQSYDTHVCNMSVYEILVLNITDTKLGRDLKQVRNLSLMYIIC